MLWHLPHIDVPALQATVDIIPYHIISQNTSTTISHLLQHPTPHLLRQPITHIVVATPKLSQQQIPHFIMGSAKAIRNNIPQVIVGSSPPLILE